MSVPPNTSALPLFEEEPLCVHHERPDPLRSMDVLTFLDDYISLLDNACVAKAQHEEETLDSCPYKTRPRSVIASVNTNVVHLGKTIVKRGHKLSNSFGQELFQSCKDLLKQ